MLELTMRATLAPAPPVDFVGKAKWTAWEAIKGKSKDDAKKEYVEKLKAVRFLSLALFLCWSSALLGRRLCLLGGRRAERLLPQRHPYLAQVLESAGDNAEAKAYFAELESA